MSTAPSPTPRPTPRSAPHRPGLGRAAGLVFGLVALAAAVFAGWTLWRVAQTPASPTNPSTNPTDTALANTQTVEAVLASVQQLVRAENFTAAEKILSDAVRQFPADQELRLSFGDLLMSRQRWSDAYDQYNAAIDTGPVPATVSFAAGTLASMTQRPELAAEHYAAAMRTDPTVPEYPLYLATAQLKLNQTAEAKASLAIAARLAPDRAEIYGMLAQIALNENKLAMAAQHAERARGIEPSETAWVLLEAKVRKRAGEPARALDLISALPQADADHPDTLALAAECYGMLGRPGDAASRYIDAAERSPTDPDLAFESAVWLERTGERAEAVRWAEKAAALGHPRAGDWIQSLAAVNTQPEP